MTRQNDVHLAVPGTGDGAPSRQGAGGSASTVPAVRRNARPGRIGLGPCHVAAKIMTAVGLLGSGLILIYRASMCCSPGL
ncbi:MAG: hypothetical protein ABR972_10960 [Acidimicrobiales bacterium]